MKITNFVAATCLAAGLGATSASAAVVINGQEVGADVVFTMSGSYDVSGASFFTTGSVSTAIGGDRGVINLGVPGSNQYDFYSVDAFPASMGTGSTVVGGIGISDLFALTRGGSTRVVGVAEGTTTGTVSGTLTFASSSFASLGLAVGSYDWTWSGDSARVNIGGPAVVPLPATLPMLGLAILGAGLVARRKKS